MEGGLVRVRGRVAKDVRIAWLEVNGRWECSVANPGFDVIDEDGKRSRIDLDPTTACCGLRQYSGPWSDLTEFETNHPFSRRAAVEGSVVYREIELRGELGVEIWGESRHVAVAAGYREMTQGPLVGVTASHVREYEGEVIAPLSRRWFAGCAAALIAMLVAPWLGAPFVILRLALLAGLACLRAVHREASPLGPAQRTPKHLMWRALVLTWFWSYLTIAYVLPMAAWFRLSAAAILAAVIAWWAIDTRRRCPPRLVRALLSDAATDGVVSDHGVRTPSVTLARADMALVWTDRLLGWEQIAFAEVARWGITRNIGELALVARTEEGWVVVCTHEPAIRPILRRAAVWDRWMLYGYGAVALAGVALALR